MVPRDSARCDSACAPALCAQAGLKSRITLEKPQESLPRSKAHRRLAAATSAGIRQPSASAAQISGRVYLSLRLSSLCRVGDCGSRGLCLFLNLDLLFCQARVYLRGLRRMNPVVILIGFCKLFAIVQQPAEA